MRASRRGTGWFGFGGFGGRSKEEEKAAKDEAARMTREADIRRLYEAGTQREVLEQLYNPEEVLTVIDKIDKERELLQFLEEEQLLEAEAEDAAAEERNRLAREKLEKEKREKEKDGAKLSDKLEALDESAKQENTDGQSVEESRSVLSGSVFSSPSMDKKFKISFGDEDDDGNVKTKVESETLADPTDPVADPIMEHNVMDVSLDDVGLESIHGNDDDHKESHNMLPGLLEQQESEDDLLKELLNTEGEESSNFDDSVTTHNDLQTLETQSGAIHTSGITENTPAVDTPLVTIDTSAVRMQSTITLGSYGSNNSEENQPRVSEISDIDLSSPNEASVSKDTENVEEIPLDSSEQEIPLDDPDDALESKGGTDSVSKKIPLDEPVEEIPLDSSEQEIPLDEPDDASESKEGTDSVSKDVPLDEPVKEMPLNSSEQEIPLDDPDDASESKEGTDSVSKEVPLDEPVEETPLNSSEQEIPLDDPNDASESKEVTDSVSKEIPLDEPVEEIPLDSSEQEIPLDDPDDASESKEVTDSVSKEIPLDDPSGASTESALEKDANEASDNKIIEQPTEEPEESDTEQKDTGAPPLIAPKGVDETPVSGNDYEPEATIERDSSAQENTTGPEPAMTKGDAGESGHTDATTDATDSNGVEAANDECENTNNRPSVETNLNRTDDRGHDQELQASQTPKRMSESDAESEDQMDAEPEEEEVEGMSDDDADADAVMDEQEQMETTSVEDDEELSGGTPKEVEDADEEMKEDVPSTAMDADEAVEEVASESESGSDEDDESDSDSESASSDDVPPPPPPPLPPPPPSVEEDTEAQETVVEEKVVEEIIEDYVEEITGVVVEEEVIVDGDQALEEEVIADDEQMEEEEVILEDSVEEEEIVVEGDNEEEIVEEEASSESSYADQVVESWAETIEELPEDLESAVSALIGVVYKDDPTVDVESMVRRTPLPELYKYLKSQYWYKIHTNKEENEKAAQVVQEKPSEIVSVDDMLKGRLQGLVSNVQQMNESIRASMRLSGDEPLIKDESILDESEKSEMSMQNLISNIENSSRNISLLEDHKYKQASRNKNSMIGIGENEEEEEEDLFLPPPVSKATKGGGGGHHVAKYYEKAVNNRVQGVRKAKRSESFDTMPDLVKPLVNPAAQAAAKAAEMAAERDEDGIHDLNNLNANEGMKEQKPTSGAGGDRQGETDGQNGINDVNHDVALDQETEDAGGEFDTNDGDMHQPPPGPPPQALELTESFEEIIEDNYDGELSQDHAAEVTLEEEIVEDRGDVEEEEVFPNEEDEEVEEEVVDDDDELPPPPPPPPPLLAKSDESFEEEIVEANESFEEEEIVETNESFDEEIVETKESFEEEIVEESGDSGDESSGESSNESSDETR